MYLFGGPNVVDLCLVIPVKLSDGPDGDVILSNECGLLLTDFPVLNVI